MASEERTEQFLRKRIGWPLYPWLPMKLIKDGKMTAGHVSAYDDLTVHLDGGGTKVFGSIKEMIDSGWRVD